MIIHMPTESEYLRIMICYQERLITLCIFLEKPEMMPLIMLRMKVKKAFNNLQLMYELCVWYMQTYGDYNYEPTGYVQPVDMTVCLADLEKRKCRTGRTQPTIID